MSTNSSKTTTNHEQIRKWAEARGGTPSRVKGTGGGDDPGMIRLDFPGYSGAGSLEEISWDEWFEAFDDNDLALVYQEKTAEGEKSNFNKLIGRETPKERASGHPNASRRHGLSGKRSSSSRSSSRSKSSGSSSRSSSGRSSSGRSSSSRSGSSRSKSGSSGRSASSGKSASGRSSSSRSSKGSSRSSGGRSR